MFLLMTLRFSNLDNTLTVFMLWRLCKNKQVFAVAVQLLQPGLGKSESPRSVVTWLHLYCILLFRGGFPGALLSLDDCFCKNGEVLMSLNLNITVWNIFAGQGKGNDRIIPVHDCLCIQAKRNTVSTSSSCKPEMHCCSCSFLGFLWRGPSLALAPAPVTVQFGSLCFNNDKYWKSSSTPC